MKEYGILYARFVFPESHRLNWLNYTKCIIPTKELHNSLKSLSNEINSEYGNDIIIPMDVKMEPGCVTTPEVITDVATKIYEGLKDIIGDKYIRLCYTVLKLEENDISIAKSTHTIGHNSPFNYSAMTVFRKFDASNKSGIFKI